jgi:pyridoxamine 5'-phosphate oxidase
MDVRDLRVSYEKDRLDPADAASAPLDQFKAWLTQALETDGLVEPNAMTVATVGIDGQPSARVVLLRGYDERGFTFFTNYESHKGHELAHTPRAALLFWWGALERQIRIEGTVARLDPAESDEYFAKRPRGHRLSAWASHQSEVVESRAVLEEQMADADARFPDDVPRPPYWGGYRVAPLRYEFWQGRRNRVHDRIVYRKSPQDGLWRLSRIAP